jgi:hypothetical protein
MSKFIGRVKEWPQTDLFRYSVPVPLRVSYSAKASEMKKG